jgi:hypothetical protein
MADLFQKDVRTISEHLANIFDEGELSREATIRKFRIVRVEGIREVAREVEHYNLDGVIAVGYRVKSIRGTQFRQRATARLKEYLIKGFIMDDERLRIRPVLASPITSTNCSSASAISGPASAGSICVCGRSSRWQPTVRPAIPRLRSSFKPSRTSCTLRSPARPRPN